MRSFRITTGLVLVLLSQFAAAEPDAAIAHPLRWSDPNGTPAGTRRSACLPLTDDVEESWSLRLPGAVAAPIIYWERIAYLICRGKKDSHYLVAVDVIEGKLLSKKLLPKGPPPQPVVWDGRVYMTIGGTELTEYSRAGKTFNRVYTHKLAQTTLSHPIVFENEIYVVADGFLMRIRARRRSPVWTAGDDTLRGRPALYGRHVYVVGRGQQHGFAPSMHLYVFDRKDGSRVLAHNVAEYRRGGIPDASKPASITVTESQVIIGAPTPLRTRGVACSHVMIDRRYQDNVLTVGHYPARLQNYPVPPAMTPLGNLVFTSAKPIGWVIQTLKGGRYISTVQENRDLYDRAQRVGPTVLGDIVYFGAWAADIRTRRILWRLPVGQLRYPAVPIDGGVLIVDDLVTLREFRARRRTR